MTDSQISVAIEKVRKGEVDDFALIVREFQQDVWRVVAFYIRDMAAIEDVVQQVFVTSFRELARFRVGEDFGAWLRGIARNLARQEVRKGAIKGRLFTEYLEHLDGLAERGEADEYSGALAEALAKCREGLPEQTYAVLAMRYEQGRSFEQIATETGRTVSGARQFLQRVRDGLRGCIEKRMTETWTG